MSRYANPLHLQIHIFLYYPIENKCLLQELNIFTAILKNVIGRLHKTRRDAAAWEPLIG